MKRAAFLQALLLVMLLAGSWLLLLGRFKRAAEPEPDPAAAPLALAPREPDPSTGLPAAESTDPAAPAPVTAVPPEGWREWLNHLQAVSSARAMRGALADLRDALFSLPPEEAVARILELLESGADVRTGLLFQVGPGGRLAGAGTLRAQLLDWLGQLDPAMAGVYAMRQLDSAGTRMDPEAYVVHLRNFAWGTATGLPGREAFMRRHFQALLDNPAWMEHPGPAIAEAMDIAVYLGRPDLVPAMAGLNRQGQPEPLRHASGIALERLVDGAPLPAVRALLDSAEGRQLDARNRAALVARLDPDSPQGQALLGRYLTAPGTSPAEVAAFLDYFPNLNQSLSHNLLSRGISNTGSAGHMERLGRALGEVESWLRDPAMAAWSGPLEAARRRIRVQMSGEPGD